MLKYEEKLHFDKHYNKLQSNGFLNKTIGLIWGIIGYGLLYYLIKYVLTYIPDIQPWNDLKIWFVIGDVRFVKVDLIYVAYGLILNCYGTIRLSKITAQNHSAKSEKGCTPNKLLISGYYAKVRHPMYGTFIILQAGFMLSLRSLAGIIIALIIMGFQYVNAIIEEKKQLIPIFNEEYSLYTNNVCRMLLTTSEIIVFISAILISAVGFAF